MEWTCPRAATRTATVVLFVGSVAAGVIISGCIGEDALIPAAVACLAFTVANVLHDRRRRIGSGSPPSLTSSGAYSRPGSGSYGWLHAQFTIRPPPRLLMAACSAAARV